jgi:hypothetical protein
MQRFATFCNVRKNSRDSLRDCCKRLRNKALQMQHGVALPNAVADIILLLIFKLTSGILHVM